MNKRSLPLFGILACETRGEPPFAEREDYALMSGIGKLLGLKVVVFSPQDICPDTGTVEGYSLLAPTGGWIREKVPLPELIYDRSFCRDRQAYQQCRSVLRQVSEKQSLSLLSRPVGGKWETLQILRRNPLLLPHLPSTVRLSVAELIRKLRRSGSAFLKPDSGTQGIGAARIQATADGLFHVCGRDQQNGSFEHTFSRLSELTNWVRRYTGGKPYLLQENLDLHTSEGHAFDIRALVQKNGRGNWNIAGMAVRTGLPGSITSNLHGGGAPCALSPFLESEFGTVFATETIAALQRLSLCVSREMEQHYGPLAELGIDLGIDRGGRIWIIEANSKPGRSAFRRMGDRRARTRSLLNPVAYARYLLERQKICLRS